MICNNCGRELTENETVCSGCGMPVESPKIAVTYKNSGTELVEAPVITEAHTFIDEENFAQRVNEKNQEAKKKEKKNKKIPIKWIGLGCLILIGIIIGIIILSKTMNHKEENPVTITSFTSEEWSVKEVKIEGDFYQLEKSFMQFYLREWDFIDDEMAELVLDPEEVTEEYEIAKDPEQGKIKIIIRNPKIKEAAMKDSEVWSIEIDTRVEENDFSFELPGKIKNGSTIEDVQKKYGELKEESITKEDEKTTTYHYAKEKDVFLDLTFVEEEGLKAFHYYVS